MLSVSKAPILVTGGTGFVGNALVQRLAKSGNHVRVISRSDSGKQQEILRETCSEWDLVEFYKGDIGGSIEPLLPAFEGVNEVYHIAGLTNSIADDAVFQRANVTATENVCEAALRTGIRKLVYVSTCDVFGIPTAHEVITEATPHRPWGEAYPDTKIEGTEVVRAYQKKGLISTILYPGWIYGPGDRAFLPSLARQLQDGIMGFWCRGGFEVYFVYIEDLVDALVLAMSSTEADNDDFLILDARSRITLKEFCQQIGDYLGIRFLPVPLPYHLMLSLAWVSQALCRSGAIKRPLLSTLDAKYFGHRFRFSVEKARGLLKWEVTTPYEEGIREALSWYREHMHGETVFKN
jgi:2-alkyl-3-oxoalkanoate reductase